MDFHYCSMKLLLLMLLNNLIFFFRYWSETKNGVCVRFYKSIILGHATADIISQSIIDSLRADRIDITKMLMLGTLFFTPISQYVSFT